MKKQAPAVCITVKHLSFMVLSQQQAFIKEDFHF
jgi:hypothetical protein